MLNQVARPAVRNHVVNVVTISPFFLGCSPHQCSLPNPLQVVGDHRNAHVAFSQLFCQRTFTIPPAKKLLQPRGIVFADEKQG